MSDLIVPLVSLVLGVAATLIVGHYYFRRTVNKSLTPFLHFSTHLLQGIAPEVRQELRVEYRGVPVEDLQELQFLIANTGERAIRDIITPLTLVLPSDCFLLDASLLHVSPPERSITLMTDEHEIRFQFPLLNSREFFLVRLLIRGKVAPKDLSFSITAEDLPPKFPITRLTPDLITAPQKREFGWGSLVASIILGVIAAALATVVYLAWDGLSRAGEGFWSYIPEWSWETLATGLAIIPIVLIVVFSVMLFFEAFSNFSFLSRRRFIVPSDIYRYRYPIFFVENGSLVTDPEHDNKNA